MNIVDKIKLNFYPELKNLDINDELLKQIISNKEFKTQYKTSIKPFIKYLSEYKYTEGYDEKLFSLDEDTINKHIKAVFELSIEDNSNRYISLVHENEEYVKTGIDDFDVFNDPNFEKLYSIIDDKIFDGNIAEIIKVGYSARLIEFINAHGKKYLSVINSSIFSDKVWNVIMENPFIGNTTILELFGSKIDILVNLINKDLFEGMKYTYENIPESNNFFQNILGHGVTENYSLKQFSMDFIKNIGDETLKTLYSRNKFSGDMENEIVEFKKLFEIASFENYELIQDIVNYDKARFSFQNISTEDMQKQLFELDIYNKGEVFLNKYFGIETENIGRIKLFLDALSKVSYLPDEFKEDYGDLLQLINQVLFSSDAELINISRTLDLDKREEYRNLIYACENIGNDIIRNSFVSDLKFKNRQIIATAECKKVKVPNYINNLEFKDGEIIFKTESKEADVIDDEITVYELSGQPFTMLVHAVTSNRAADEHNSFANEIINNPENWSKMDGGNNHISTSLISNKYMKTYGIPKDNKTLMFGFDDFSDDCLKYTATSDVGIERKASTNMDYNKKDKFSQKAVNLVTTVDDLMRKTIELNLRKHPSGRQWNEIGLSRVDEKTGFKIQPSFIVCMDGISESSMRAALQLNLPIYLINLKCYQELPYINENSIELETVQTIESENITR